MNRAGRCLTATIVSAVVVAACTQPPPAPESAQPAPAATSDTPQAVATAGNVSPVDRPAATPEAASRDQPPTLDAIARVMAPWNGDLDQMVTRRYVRMLVTFSKTNYFLDQAEQHGITYDAGKLFETFLNHRLAITNPMLHVVFIPVSRNGIFHDLAAGRGDIAAAGLTITPDRQQLVTFASPLLTGVREVVVTSADQPAVNRAEDLSGRTVHVRRSSSYFDSLTMLNTTLAARNLAPVEIVEAPEELEDEDLLEMVNAGLIPVTIADDHLAGFWSKVFDGIRVQPADVRSNGEIAWAVRSDAPQLRDAVNAFVRANPKGSRNFNIVYQRYLRNTKFVTNSASEQEMRKFREIRSLFEKYGEQYDLPWLLLAAQGYQESQLDQRRRSRVGAVGVMQIKPSTAAGAPINITGVDASADRNIQAGVKYLRFIFDRYFKGAPMDPINQGLFVMASYNAGPARIAQLRKQAAMLGLDQNKWFGNVEIVAAHDIGRETVTYVSNIYKYYVAYSLVMQQTQARRRALAR